MVMVPGVTSSRRFRCGAPLDLRKEKMVQWLLVLKKAEPERFERFPDERQDVTDVTRGLLFELFFQMIEAGLYAKPKCDAKVNERLWGLRLLIGEARDRG